jgi:hypothetical protein
VRHSYVWARAGETIVRVRIPPGQQSKIRLADQFYAFPEAIPSEWCEVLEVVKK